MFFVWCQLVGHKQAGWTVLCCEKNPHQKSVQGRLHEGELPVWHKPHTIKRNHDGQLIVLMVVLQVLREVKVLSSLQHVNIVGYHTAWLEHVQPADSEYLQSFLTVTQTALSCDQPHVKLLCCRS